MTTLNPYQASEVDAPTERVMSAGYGVVIVAIAAAAMVATLPGRTHGLGLVTESLIQDLEISRVGYAQLNLWATLLGALFCLPCGWLIDRLGSRWMLSFVLAALAAAVLAMSRAQSFVTLFLYVMLTRGLGQSMLSVVSITLVGKWFNRRLPLAMGAYSLLIGIGFAISFKTVGSMVLSWEWRDAWAAIGLVLLAFAPIAWLLVRDDPSRGRQQSASSPVPESSSATLRQALASPSFWVFATATCVYGMISSGISLFNQSILAERGFTPDVFHTVLAVSSLTGMASNLIGGWIAARWSLGGVLGAAMFAFGAALLFLPYVQTIIHVYVYAVTIGAAGGIVTVVFFSVWGHAFGSRDLGKIQGVAQMLTVVTSAVGPLAFAECYAKTGSYTMVFFIVAPTAAAMGILAWLVPLPVAAAGGWKQPPQTNSPFPLGASK